MPVRILRDQERHDELFDLHDIRGHPVSGKIHIILQWIHSRVKYLSDIVKKWDNHINAQIEDKTDFERDLETLYQPFQGLSKLSALTPVTQSHQKKPAFKNNFSAIEKGFQYKQGRNETYSLNEHTQVWFEYAYIGSLIVLAFSLFAGFARDTFLDVI